jgi:hypothetical protein
MLSVQVPDPGACGTGFDPASLSPDVMFVPPVVHGQCALATGVRVADPILRNPARACVPDRPQDTVCAGDSCTLALPAPYRVCIEGPFYECPAGSPFTQPLYLQTEVPFTCSSCLCGVEATCAGAVELFSDTQCMKDEIDIAADTTCCPTVPGFAQALSYKYVLDGDLTDEVTCNQEPSTAVGPSVPQLVCCMP